MRSRGARLAVTAIGLVSALLLAGCGGGDKPGGSEDYEALLRGLKKAALTTQAYNAVDRAKSLEPTLRASIDAFCETNREMLVNNEAWKAKNGPYYFSRLRLRAERELPFVSTHPVTVAIDKYKVLFNLAGFDPAAVRRYAKACYR
jgi:hypothetical protein